MSTQRTIWLIFCLSWVGFWLLIGWLFLPFINIALAGLSAAAIAIPVGSVKRERLVTPGFEKVHNQIQAEKGN